MNVQTAQHLADLRRSKGYSQEMLARELGLSRQAVSKWERAESSPDTDNLIALAKLYGVSLDELLQTSACIEDDIAFENRDRAAENADAEDATDRAIKAAEKATDAATAAAQAASATARALNTASTTAIKARLPKGPFRSFPYWAVAIVLAILLGTQTGAWALLVFFTIPVYHWIANILDAGLSETAVIKTMSSDSIAASDDSNGEAESHEDVA